jgi:hypothetical protein
MTRLFLFFFILSTSLSFAASLVCEDVSSEEVLTAVKLHGFSCTKQILADCAYNECTGKLGSYPKPVLITIPQTINSLRLHFHGHILGLAQTKPYEGNLRSMVKAFGIQKSLCENSEVTIIPQSTGANSTYKEFFKDKNSYTQFFADVQSTLGNHLKGNPLHLSGHSGGGKYVAAALNAEIKTAKVSIFDGIYSASTKDSLRAWYQKGEGKLTLATVKGMDPEKFANELRREMGVKFESNKSTIQGTNYDVHKNGNFIHYSRGYSNTAHFNSVSEIWPINN